MKRKLFLGLAAVAIMVSGIAAGMAWTQVAHAQEETTAKSFAARLATILGLEEDVVQDAFKEARRDIQGARFQTRMDRLVESERITQDEADAAIEWYAERPEGINKSSRGSRSGFYGQRGPGSKSGFHGRRDSVPRSGFYGQRGPNSKSGFQGRRGPGSKSGFQERRGPGSKSDFQERRGPGSRSGFYGQRGPGSESGFQGRRGSGPDYGFRGRGRPGPSSGNQS